MYSTTRPRQPVGWFVAIALLAVAVLGAAAALPVLVLRNTITGTATSGYESSARTAARDGAVALMTLSYRTVDSDMNRVLALSTGEFRRQYTQSKDTVRTAVLENKVRSTAQVRSAAVSSAGPKAAVVLIAIDANVRNVKAPSGTTAHYRMSVTVVPVHGRWLVSKLSYVS